MRENETDYNISVLEDALSISRYFRPLQYSEMSDIVAGALVNAKQRARNVESKQRQLEFAPAQNLNPIYQVDRNGTQQRRNATK